MDEQTILSLVVAHKWIALSSLAIGLVVRLLKADGPIPINLPPQYRPWLAVALGVVSGALDKTAEGISWQNAIASGLVSALLAMSTHDLVIESVRKGRELGEKRAAFAVRMGADKLANAPRRPKPRAGR